MYLLDLATLESGPVHHHTRRSHTRSGRDGDEEEAIVPLSASCICATVI